MKIKVYTFSDELVAKRAAGEKICVRCGAGNEEEVCEGCGKKVGSAENLAYEAELAVKQTTKNPKAFLAYQEAAAEVLEEVYAAPEPVVAETVVAETPAPAKEKAQLSKKQERPRVDAKLTAHMDTIAKMHSGECKTVCAIVANGVHCGLPKDPKNRVCSECHKKYYWIGHQVVDRALERAANWIEPELFGQVVETAKTVIQAAAEELDEKDLVSYLRKPPAERVGVDFPDFSALPFGGIQNAVRAAKKAIEAENQKASKNGDRWDFTIAAIKEKYSVGQPQAADFAGLRHASGPITEAMIKRACEAVWAERWETWSQEAMEKVGKPAVEKQFPDGYIDVGYFSEGVIEDLGLVFEGKLLTEKMLKRCAHEVINERKLNKVHAVAKEAFGKKGGNGGRPNRGEEKNWRGHVAPQKPLGTFADAVRK